MSAPTLPDLSDHQPTRSLGDGRERCEADGYLWPCPDIRMHPPALTDDERAVMEMVDIGWSVWERVDPEANHAARGGTVVGWDDAAEGHRRYRVLAGFRDRRPHFVTIDAAAINPAADVGVVLPNARGLRATYRSLARAVGERSGTADETELDHLALALDLARAVI